jgi:hypothetical protein
MTAHGAGRFSRRPPVGGHTGGLTGDSLQLTRGQPALLLDDKTTASGEISCDIHHGTQARSNEIHYPIPALPSERKHWAHTRMLHFDTLAGASGRTSSTNASSIDFGVSMTRLMSTPAAGAAAWVCRLTSTLQACRARRMQLACRCRALLP